MSNYEKLLSKINEVTVNIKELKELCDEQDELREKEGDFTPEQQKTFNEASLRLLLAIREFCKS